MQILNLEISSFSCDIEHGNNQIDYFEWIYFDSILFVRFENNIGLQFYNLCNKKIFYFSEIKYSIDNELQVLTNINFNKKYI